ncbi:MAG TPA: hypothetical protein ENL03_03910, partial [Phycisphaerae bacterium]|nr:hypothetical protein [Phycisphaerae bacterium]
MNTRKTAISLLVLALLSLLIPAGCGPAGNQGSVRLAVDKAVKDIYPSLVRIHVVVQSPGSGRLMKFQASGSGAIISDEGHVLTNHHVAGNATRIFCRLSSRKLVEARLVGTDAMTDLAV